MTTPNLLDLLEPVPDWVHVAEPQSIEARFWAFHTAHPEVYAELARMAHMARQAGRERIGMKMCFEVIRWNRFVAGLPDETEEYRLNNDYSSRYSRLLMEREPELDGLFATRELRAA